MRKINDILEVFWRSEETYSDENSREKLLELKWKIQILIIIIIEETCCHSNFRERPSSKADVKNSPKIK